MKKMIGRFKRYIKHRKKFKNEWCVVLIEHTPFRKYVFGSVDLTTRSVYGYESEWIGTPGSVEFNYRWVYDREDEWSDVAGFYHTHPSRLGEARPSITDITTMNAWTKCLGKPLLCYIDNGWSINCWVFDQYGYFKQEDMERIINDPFRYERIDIKRN